MLIYLFVDLFYVIVQFNLIIKKKTNFAVYRVAKQ